MCVCVCVCVWERERERDRETETETERDRERKTTEKGFSYPEHLISYIGQETSDEQNFISAAALDYYASRYEH